MIRDWPLIRYEWNIFNDAENPYDKIDDVFDNLCYGMQIEDFKYAKGRLDDIERNALKDYINDNYEGKIEIIRNELNNICEIEKIFNIWLFIKANIKPSKDDLKKIIKETSKCAKKFKKLIDEKKKINQQFKYILVLHKFYKLNKLVNDDLGSEDCYKKICSKMKKAQSEYHALENGCVLADEDEANSYVVTKKSLLEYRKESVDGFIEYFKKTISFSMGSKEPNLESAKMKVNYFLSKEHNPILDNDLYIEFNRFLETIKDNEDNIKKAIILANNSEYEKAISKLGCVSTKFAQQGLGIKFEVIGLWEERIENRDEIRNKLEKIHSEYLESYKNKKFFKAIKVAKKLKREVLSAKKINKEKKLFSKNYIEKLLQSSNNMILRSTIRRWVFWLTGEFLIEKSHKLFSRK